MNDSDARMSTDDEDDDRLSDELSSEEESESGSESEAGTDGITELEGVTEMDVDAIEGEGDGEVLVEDEIFTDIHLNVEEGSHPLMRVGEEYQAVLPTQADEFPKPLARVPSEMVWTADSDPDADAKVESLLTQVRRAVGPDAYNDVVHDTALVTLHACGMVVDKALAHLATINYGVRATDTWSPEEKALFEKCANEHSKYFHLYRTALPHRTTTEIVRYYYRWKRSAEYEAFLSAPFRPLLQTLPATRERRQHSRHHQRAASPEPATSGRQRGGRDASSGRRRRGMGDASRGGRISSSSSAAAAAALAGKQRLSITGGVAAKRGRKATRGGSLSAAVMSRELITAQGIALARMRFCAVCDREVSRGLVVAGPDNLALCGACGAYFWYLCKNVGLARAPAVPPPKCLSRTLGPAPSNIISPFFHQAAESTWPGADTFTLPHPPLLTGKEAAEDDPQHEQQVAQMASRMVDNMTGAASLAVKEAARVAGGRRKGFVVQRVILKSES